MRKLDVRTESGHSTTLRSTLHLDFFCQPRATAPECSGQKQEVKKPVELSDGQSQAKPGEIVKIGR